VEAIAFHHAPERIKEIGGKELMIAVYAAELMTKAWSAEASRPPGFIAECLALLDSVAPGISPVEWRDLTLSAA
jgi:hypothetical protein